MKTHYLYGLLCLFFLHHNVFSQDLLADSTTKKVEPPPMSLEQLKSKALALRYNRGDLTDYDAMKKRLADLDSLRSNATLYYTYTLKKSKEAGSDTELQDAMKTSTIIRQSHAILRNDMEDIEAEKGNNAWRVFVRLDIKDIYDPVSSKLNKELIKELKENIFFTKKPFDIVCEKGGVGQFLGNLSYTFDGKQPCKGYRVSLGTVFNLLILKLEDGKTIGVVVDKNIQHGSYGAIKIIE